MTSHDEKSAVSLISPDGQDRDRDPVQTAVRLILEDGQDRDRIIRQLHPKYRPRARRLADAGLAHRVAMHLSIDGAVLCGDGGVGKSLLAMQLAASTALSLQWVGMDINRPGPVTYWSAEDDKDEVHRRLESIFKMHGSRFDDCDNLHVFPRFGKDAIFAVHDATAGAMTPTPLFGQFLDHCRAVGPSLVVLDNLADIFGGNEVVRSQATQFIGICRRLALELDCSVVILAHPSVTGMNSGSGTSGSTGWSNAARSRLYLTVDRDSDGNVVDPNTRLLSRLKAN